MDVAPRPGLLQRVRKVLCRQQYILWTEKTYLFLVRDFIHFNDYLHLRRLPPSALERYLGALATEPWASAST